MSTLPKAVIIVFHSSDIGILRSPLYSSLFSSEPSALPHFSVSVCQSRRDGDVLDFHLIVMFLLAMRRARLIKRVTGVFLVLLGVMPSI